MDEEAEVAVNVSDCKAAMMELREIVRGSGIAVNFITEVCLCIQQTCAYTPTPRGTLEASHGMYDWNALRPVLFNCSCCTRESLIN